jgi:hypothetical protein
VKTTIAAATAVVAVLACFSASAATPAEAKRYVADAMRDPLSVQFRDVRTYSGGVVCGEYNAKNGYGAYTGFKDFVYIAGPKYTFREPKASAHDVATLCTNRPDKFPTHARVILEQDLASCEDKPADYSYGDLSCEETAAQLVRFRASFPGAPIRTSFRP